MTINNTDNSLTINKCLLSSMKLYSEFCASNYSYEYDNTTGNYVRVEKKYISMSAGSAVIYKIDNDYTYIITNYHVVYNKNVNSDNNGNIARKVVGYLYGSEGNITYTTQEDSEGNITNVTDENGYYVYNYGNLGINLEYIGGAVTYDIALLRANTEDILEINNQVRAITFASDYYVGQTAIAIGNPEDEGISVTEGIISVDNENIQLNIDGTTRSYRCMRIDTPLYSGNSGGGLFNLNGDLIGITNAGNTSEQNVNYAIPFNIVKNVVENIIHYCLNDNDDNTNGVYKILLGVTVQQTNSKYVYDSSLGYGHIEETNIVISVMENSISSALQLQENDEIKSIIIDDKEYIIYRSFTISDALLNVRIGSTIKLKVLRDNNIVTTETYTVISDDIYLVN